MSPVRASRGICSYACSMTEHFGITSPGSIGRRKTPPDGHTDMCWVRAQTASRDGRSWEEYSLTNVAALDGLRTGKIECTCDRPAGGRRRGRSR